MDINTIASKADLERLTADLKSFIGEAVKQQAVSEQRWLRNADMKRLFGLSASGLQNLRASGKLPFTKIGGTIFYDFIEVGKMLKRNEHKAFAN